jgi:S-DNA-T family DNA segregation ATPase FtsK/SpoIIIE
MTTAAHTPEQTADRPALTLVTDEPRPLEGTVVKHQGAALDRPAWILSGTELARQAGRHAVGNRLYIGWTLRGYDRLARRFIDGWRDDYPQMIRSARDGVKAAKGDVDAESRMKNLVERRRAEYKRHRLIYSAKTGAWATPIGAAAGVGIAQGGLWVSVLLGMVTVTVGAMRGRPSVIAAEDDPGRIEILAEEGEPFPIADASTRTEAAECVRRALVSEGVNVASVEANRRYDWGWEVTVRLKKGTPADLIAKAPELETPLDLPTDGLLCQPLRKKRSRVVLRLVEGDPFETMPALPERAPNSLRMRDKALVGKRMDGQATELSFLGVHFITIASSGGGKSVTLRTIGDVLTACDDVVVVDLDPGGNGLEPLAEAVGVRVVGADEMHLIEAVLEKLLKIAKARATLLGKLGMGDNWIPSREYPAIVALVDEYPQLSQKAKALVVAILRVGRKSRVQIGLAAQEATKDAIGAAIADSIALKIVGPSRHQDIVQVFGAGAGANGWRPDRLHPAQGEDPADAGKVYIMGAGSTDPLIHKFIAIGPEEGKRRAAERAKAGRPWIDALSLNTAGVTFDDLDTIRPHDRLPEPIELARAAFTAADDPERMTTDALYEYVAAASPEAWAPREDEEVEQARNRYLEDLREAAAEIAPKVDMKTRQWRGGRGYYLSTLIELTGEEA